MSEETYEIWIDEDPYLWDTAYEATGLMEIINYAKDNYELKGSCKNCGRCCNWIDREGVRHPCKYLLTGNICEIYDTRPQVCVRFPEKPTTKVFMSGNYLLPDNETTANPEGCGYYWIKKT